MTTAPERTPDKKPSVADILGIGDGELFGSIIDDNERPGSAFVNASGLTRDGEDGVRGVDVPVLLVVTDRRLVFAPVPDESPDGRTISLPYDEIVSVECEDGEVQTLTVMTANGTKWRYQFPSDEPAAVDAASRHLLWVGEVRTRVVGMRNDIEYAADEIRTHANEMEWDLGEKRYAETRQSLDRLVEFIQRTEPIDDAVLAPELTDMERTLEEAVSRLHIDHVDSQLELGRQLVATENYDQARKILEEAQSKFEAAETHSEAVQRGDAFQFGEQRALQDELDRLRWEIETVATEPVRQAHQAKTRAQNADETGTAVELWEVAFRRYGHVLTIDWEREADRAPVDWTDIYDELETAAERLVELRGEAACDRWNTGVSHKIKGNMNAALQACSEARDDLARAHELAVEFGFGDIEEMGNRLERMDAVIAELRDTTGNPDEDTDADDSDETGPMTDSEGRPTADIEGGSPKYRSPQRPVEQ